MNQDFCKPGATGPGQQHSLLLHRTIAEYAFMERAGKSGGSKAAVAAGVWQAARRGDLAGGSIRARQELPRAARGLAKVVAFDVQIGLLDMILMPYRRAMDHHNDTPRPPPAGWLEALERSEADLAAGRTVPLEPALERMRDSIKRMEARRAARGAEATGQA